MQRDGSLVARPVEEYTLEHPPFLFHHDDFSDTSVEAHPRGEYYVRPIRPVANTYQVPLSGHPHLVPKGWPLNFEDMLKRKLPQFSLHVMTFCDATLVAMAWPHSTIDGIGQRDLLRNWSLVMAGREAEVQTVLGARHDVLEDLVDEATEEYLIDKNKMSTLGLLRFFAPFKWRAIRHPPRRRMIYLPRAMADQIMSKARQNVSQLKDESGNPVRISDADIVLAWATRVIALHHKHSAITAVGAVNARYRLPSLLNAAGIYLQNMVLLSFSSVPWDKAATAPLGELALRHRQNMELQLTEEQVLAGISCRHRNLRSGKEGNPFCGHPRSLVFGLNSMAALGLMDAADFSPAVLRAGDIANRCNKSGSMASVYFLVADRKPSGPSFYVPGRDAGGNLWMWACLSDALWKVIELELDKMNRRDGAQQVNVK